MTAKAWHAKLALMHGSADIRKMALALEGVSEIEHFDKPAFRTKKRIFAVVRPDGLFLHLPEERKEFLFEAHSKTFVKLMWGKRANVIVKLSRVSRRELEALVREAWETVAPAPKKTATAESIRKVKRKRQISRSR